MPSQKPLVSGGLLCFLIPARDEPRVRGEHWRLVGPVHIVHHTVGPGILSNLVLGKGIIEPYGGYPVWANWVGGWGMVVAAVVVAFALSRKFKPVVG